MSRPFAAALALALATFSASLAQAGAYKTGALTVSQPWSRPAQAGMNGVGFMTIANAGKTPVILKRVESAAAAKVEMHQSSMADGVMSMRRRDDGISVPPGGQLVFAPGGYHLMLLGLKQAQAPGEKVSITLIFDNGRKIPVDLAVRLTPPAAAPTGQAAPHAMR